MRSSATTHDVVAEHEHIHLRFQERVDGLLRSERDLLAGRPVPGLAEAARRRRGIVGVNVGANKDTADRVADYLTGDAGVPRERVVVRGMADTHPVAPNDTREGRAKNRRIEVLVDAYGG